MTAGKLWWILFKAILRGHRKAPIYFDTEARTFGYHMAKVGRAYCQDCHTGDGFWITLHEETAPPAEGINLDPSAQGPVD